MSRNRRAGGGVRGPASALTSFLAGLGVEPSHQLTTWGNTSSLPGNGDNDPQNDDDHLAPDGPILDEQHLDPAGAVTAATVEAGPSQVGENSPPRKRAASVDSDDLDAPAVQEKAKVPPGPLKPVGHFMLCGECTNKFTVTAYTKEHPKAPLTWLCVKCCTALGIDPFAKASKPKPAKKAKKEDRAKVVHYEQRKGVNPLGDMCIHMIGKYIEDVDQLGDIGGINMDKVCRIISKSRRLTPETAPLFFAPERVELDLYDCTLLRLESYQAIAKLCPRLESLSLQLCGQLTADALLAWKDLPLKRVELFGPFLVRKEGWISLFESHQLQALLVTQSPRIDLETVEKLVQACPDLTELRLAEVGKLDDTFLAPISQLKLRYLDLSSPSSSLSDDAVIQLLGALKGTLEHLDLSDNYDLSDDILPALARCKELRHLRLRNIEFSDEGVAEFFESLEAKGLETIDLEKGHDLKGDALRALIRHCGQKLTKLSILGWREADQDSLATLSQCPLLEELNLGWCRNVTDFTLKDILDGCTNIKTIRVWGCNQLTDAVPRKKGVQIIGIESHSI